jgi:hypothetical protein
MTATIPNIAKGRINEFVNRVNDNDPATSGFVVVLLVTTGLEAIGVLRDYDTLAAILAAANDECTVASYARLVLTDTDVAAPTVDDGADTQSFDTGDFDFGALETGQTIGASVMCYAPDTTGADSTFIPVQITVPTAGIATDGTTFFWRTPNGIWDSTE